MAAACRRLLSAPGRLGKGCHVAACAPRITQAGTPIRVQGAYDCLRNTRFNHAPRPTAVRAMLRPQSVAFNNPAKLPRYAQPR